MFQKGRDDGSYVAGFCVSVIGHALFYAISLLVIGHARSNPVPLNEVFSVTLEGGEKLGGISQVPTEKWTKKAIPNATEASEAESEKVQREEKKTEAKLTEPSAVEDPEKILAEKRKEELKLAEELKKKVEAEKKRKDEEKKKVEEDKKKAEEEKKKKEEKEEADREKQEEAKKEKERKERDKALSRAISRASANASQYHGESANAGGEGFGAAAVGGHGMGGGKLESIEFIAFRNQLEKHIKSGWHWLPTRDHLSSQVEFSLLPDGTIQDPNVVASSGNSAFDESALRAVMKASPCPVPPASVYDRFKLIRITFDTEQ